MTIQWECLTNNPPFEQQMFQLNQLYDICQRQQPENHLCKKTADLKTYSRGMGALGTAGRPCLLHPVLCGWHLPRLHSHFRKLLRKKVSASFSTSWAVWSRPRGCCEVEPEKYEITIYTSCCNATKGIYYYTTYENHQITAVDMHREDLDGNEVKGYPLQMKQQIFLQNA